ncbi:hypothetical protein Vafri_18161 [Volvox africanus]|uniref:Uncharacterized protein n=1 Tax=Volvox africanus TaxID=51714 RepID=A0A8J4FBH1_9CHLO|nr:hypothetical protein Vafri_18161 [Volvox africanus]
MADATTITAISGNANDRGAGLAVSPQDTAATGVRDPRPVQMQNPAAPFNMGMQNISHNGMMPAAPSFQFGAPELQGAGSFPQPQPTFGVSAGDGRLKPTKHMHSSTTQ